MNRACDGALALAVCWSARGEHLGEVICVPSGVAHSPWIFGTSIAEEPRPERLYLTRRRPGRVERCRLEDPGLAADELALAADARGIEVRMLGKNRLLTQAGRYAESVRVSVGETVEIADHLLLLCVWQPIELPGSAPDAAAHPFGEADPYGFVGESPAAWRLREQIEFMAGRSGHLLLFGQSGTGKELVARAIHALSPRRERSLVARNAAVFPASLVDAELFGNVANYPNVGSPERPGLIGQAQGSTLFLDEVGELPPDLQAHLLRVLDAGGEYQRLGEARSRHADIRILGATARRPEDLRLDFGARFRLRLELPTLNERRQDIPLIARRLLLQAARCDPFVERLLASRGAGFGVGPALMRQLVTHHYRAHVRELDALLWHSMSGGCGLEPNDELAISDRRASEPAPSESKTVPRLPPTASEVRASLERHGGVKERAWRDLGLSSRHALKRLIRKYELHADPASGDSEP
jgi:two-component system response regulator HydG